VGSSASIGLGDGGTRCGSWFDRSSVTGSILLTPGVIRGRKGWPTYIPQLFAKKFPRQFPDALPSVPFEGGGCAAPMRRLSGARPLLRAPKLRRTFSAQARAARVNVSSVTEKRLVSLREGRHSIAMVVGCALRLPRGKEPDRCGGRGRAPACSARPTLRHPPFPCTIRVSPSVARS
jgi:hypothetical protein